ncbi:MULTISPECIES: ABC transporter ATP-binding protein [unclassified Cellulosimicrobium]|uniref:ABC transporter ATP-binding protein n=1 Tax=unclassified Cellulosimicrobium TaxID=2624466 RepID=UPI0021F31402|nr:ABC transporter ATP-binding protein [Cellulosimicrobium sp. SH8]
MTLGARGLTFSYRRGSAPVVSDLSLDLEPGTLTAVTGPSGSGKSTLLYLLALMLRGTSGTVLWDGEPVSALPDARRAQIRARDVGFVFQDAVLDPTRTVLDNVCDAGLFGGLDRRARVRRAHDLLERFGVEHRADHRPGEVSGGQAQRVALCRALLTRPRVLLGDEPTGNLDPVSARVVWEALQAHAADGATVVVATHDPRLAAESSRRLEIS